jgi:hypothetical protein
MIRRAKSAARVLLAAALLYGSGAHWLLAQGAAWAGMVAARAGRTSVAEALATTFDGRHPCRVCRIVKRGAGADSTPRAGRPAPTVDFAFASIPAVLPAAEAARPFPDASPDFASAPRVPPSPPPNLLRVA